MVLSKERLQTEISACKETIKKLEGIGKDSISGIEINKIVLKGLEHELVRLNRNHKELNALIHTK